MKIKITSGNVSAVAELKNTPTARAIYEVLPIEGSANRWGDEIYLVIPVNLDLENDAKEIVSEGDIAYWPEGSCFCIFWGKTPASKGNEIRAASKVNVFGRIKEDAKIFKNIKNSDLVILEKA
ncbi:hypothetical protein HYX05_04700 [Candidatus Woesearchaeota archaeon]|nr:hypothetical protein [Candidatus Woesearchaeota archaeon]